MASLQACNKMIVRRGKNEKEGEIQEDSLHVTDNNTEATNT